VWLRELQFRACEERRVFFSQKYASSHRQRSVPFPPAAEPTPRGDGGSAGWADGALVQVKKRMVAGVEAQAWDSRR